MADLHLQSAILQSALEALHGGPDGVASGGEDAIHVEAENDTEAEDDVDVEAGEEPISPATPRMLPPPNGRQFDTRDAAESFLKVFCAQQGYSVSCRRCLRKGVRGFKASFYCTLGRSSDRGDKLVKNTKKTGCPMEFGLDCLRRTDFRWTIDSSISKPHNHGPVVKTPRPVVPFPRRRKVAVPVEQVALGKMEGKRALITGADSGIGRAVATLFAREGADMSIVYLPHEKKDAEWTQRLVEREGRACLLIPGNLMDNQTCKAAVDAHVHRFGMISVLVNNASKQILCDDITKMDLDAVESTFRTNILQMFAITKYAVPHIGPGGSVINTTSTQADRGISTAVDYSATKGAVVSFTRALGKQLMAKSIRVNAIALASVAVSTGATSRPVSQVEGTSQADSQVGTSARFQEVARSFLFLAGMESSSFYGQVLNAHPVED